MNCQSGLRPGGLREAETMTKAQTTILEGQHHCMDEVLAGLYGGGWEDTLDFSVSLGQRFGDGLASEIMGRKTARAFVDLRERARAVREVMTDGPYRDAYAYRAYYNPFPGSDAPTWSCGHCARTMRGAVCTRCGTIQRAVIAA